MSRLRLLVGGVELPAAATVSMDAGALEDMLARAQAGRPPEELSTAQAAAFLGKSRQWWEKHAGEIEGAWQEGEGGTWSLPYRACRAYMDGLRSNHERRSRLRGPRKQKQQAA